MSSQPRLTTLFVPWSASSPPLPLPKVLRVEFQKNCETAFELKSSRWHGTWGFELVGALDEQKTSHIFKITFVVSSPSSFVFQRGRKTGSCVQFKMKDRMWKKIYAMNQPRKVFASAVFHARVVVSGGFTNGLQVTRKSSRLTTMRRMRGLSCRIWCIASSITV